VLGAPSALEADRVGAPIQVLMRREFGGFVPALQAVLAK
jgi:hypothetical protein